MKRFLPSLLLGLSLVLSGCTTKSPTPSITPSPTSSSAPIPTATISPSPVSAAPPAWGVQEDTYLQLAADDLDIMLVEGRFTLPHIENAAGVSGYTAINRWYAQLLTDLKGDVMENVAQAQDDYETAQALEIPFIGYSDEEIYEVIYQSETTSAILRTHFSHSSGTFPSVLYLVDRFDLHTGAYLSFADYFTDPQEAQAIILAEVMRQGAEHPEYDQETISSAFHPEFFYPTETGLLFFYQPETLNDQAVTKPEFVVPYGLLEGLLRR